MPKISEGASYRKKYKKEDIKKALETIENGMSNREAFKLYKVPRATLQFQTEAKFIRCVSPSKLPKNCDPENVLNKSITDFVVWPVTPERKGKRQTEKLPWVLTSSVRKDALKQKIAKKKRY
ncbi:hypothetical protein RN001_007809 [Aquatica leii]|uniref:HTH psq-type domain-containing protein n=1 Tax=Aquatica leii TaxID=1421715 RepID=A0AAN7QIL2_9COLE|nr:hypothetical protein RN001_007809 [Aquatica leii]